MAEGKTELKRNRFLKVKGAKREINYELVESSKLRAGIKGHVADLGIPAGEVIGAYRQLFEVERSFRMAKSDLKARPIFHHKREAIEAHLTVVFAAYAIAGVIQKKAGLSIERFIRMLAPVRTGAISLNGATHKVPPKIPGAVQEVLDSLE